MNVWPWIALAVLGAWHGLNPSMGWLFAVSLGLQNRSRTAVFRGMGAIALGHTLSVLAILGLVFLIGKAFPANWFGLIAGLLLAGVGAWRLIRGRHPRWVGMQVSFGELTWWSCLMSSAHGAGLMLLPVFLVGGGTWCDGASVYAGSQAASFGGIALMGVGLHALLQFVVATIVAWLVYDIVGLAILRKSWFNADLIWSLSLLLTGVFMLAMRAG